MAALAEHFDSYFDRLAKASAAAGLHRWRINISTVLAGQRLGIREVCDGIWLVSFRQNDLGYFDPEQSRLSCGIKLDERGSCRHHCRLWGSRILPPPEPAKQAKRTEASAE